MARAAETRAAMNAPAIDFNSINAAASSAAHDVLCWLLPGGKFSGPEYIALNPRRNDKTLGSFAINVRSGVWSDFATGEKGGDYVSLVAYIRGCSQGDAARELADKLRVLLRIAVAASSTSASRASSETAKIYNYGDEGPPRFKGELRHHVYKRNDGKPVKIKIKLKNERYAQLYRVPAGWQMKQPDDYCPVPYVTAGIDRFDREYDQVLWPEGEKDVDELHHKLGLLAFTFGGVGDGLPNDIAQDLEGRDIVILADNDDPGRAHAEKKAAVAHAAGASSIKVVHFLELQPKEDVSDFIARGGTREDLMARIDAAPLWKPRQETTIEADDTGIIARRASDIEAEPIDWLWPNRIAIGKLTLFAGDPGLGKSQLTVFLAAVVSTGDEWPCGEGRAKKGSIVLLSAEDDAADTIVPRLMGAGANLNRVHIVEAVKGDNRKGNTTRRMFHLQEDLVRLEALLSKLSDVRLVIIDPITAYLGGIDTHRNSDVRGVLGLVKEMAARCRVAVVAISHWNKSNGGSALNRVTGSGAFVAAARSGYMVAKDPDDDSDTRRLFVPMKNNLGALKNGLVYRVESRSVGNDIPTSAIFWESEKVTRSADEIMAANNPDGDRGARDEAADWLEELLVSGPVDAKEVRSQSEAAGLSWTTVKRAKRRLGIKPERQSDDGSGKGKWVWRLPQDRVQGDQKS
jgi:putative DNA primase/helicase